MAAGHRDLLLVVDDSDTMRDLLERQLAERGYDVVGAADGERALALVARAAARRVLLDHELPGLTAWRCSPGCAPTTASPRCR